jgi:hypothetical protein
MAAMTLLLAGLAVSTFAFALDFFLLDEAAAACLLTRDFFSIDIVVPPGSNFNQEEKGQQP